MVWTMRVAAKMTVGNYFDLRQQRSKSPSRGRLSRTSLATDQYSTNLGAHRIQDQRTNHAFLTYNCGKRKDSSCH
jgi:hypothetical protein